MKRFLVNLVGCTALALLLTFSFAGLASAQTITHTNVHSPSHASHALSPLCSPHMSASGGAGGAPNTVIRLSVSWSCIPDPNNAVLEVYWGDGQYTYQYGIPANWSGTYAHYWASDGSYTVDWSIANNTQNDWYAFANTPVRICC